MVARLSAGSVKGMSGLREADGARTLIPRLPVRSAVRNRARVPGSAGPKPRIHAVQAPPAALGYQPLPATGDVCAFARGSDVVVAAPVRVGAELLTPDALGVPGAADAWTDLLAPLDAVYGRRRPAVFERVPGASPTSKGRDGSAR
jgi:hypothetical protein